MSTDPLLRVTGVQRHYGRLQAVSTLAFELQRGEVVGLLGVNGAGKSTTLAMLAGVLAPSAGVIQVDGKRLEDGAAAVRGLIGYLPEHPPLHAELTVEEYLAFCARLRGLDVQACVARVCRRCGLEAVRRRLIGNLSKGFQQRVGIAQAVLHEPPLIILDEPTSGLDPIQNHDIRVLVRELGREHGVLLSTHILTEVQETCSRVLMIAGGRLLLDQSLAELAGHGGHGATCIALRNPPPEQALLGIDGVLAVEQLGEGRFRVSHAGHDDPAERIAERAVAGGWGLRELTPETASLEQHFMRLACAPAAEDDTP